MGRTDWSFLTAHGRVLLCIAQAPDARLRDLASASELTERRVFGVVNDLAEAGYIVKLKDGRRNRYHVQEDLPVPEELGVRLTIGQVLELLFTASDGQPEAASAEG